MSCKLMSRWLAGAAALLLLTTGAGAQDWTASWGTAQIRVEGQDADKAPLPGPVTVRQPVRLSIGGPRLRVRLSNLFGTQPLLVDGAAVGLVLTPGQAAVRDSRPLTFAGARWVRIPPGAEMYSDPVDLPTQASADLAVTLHLPAAPAVRTGHPGSRATAFTLAGDHVDDTAFADATALLGWHLLADVEVDATAEVAPARTIVAIGDSITDGYGVQPDTYQRWTDHLLTRLRGHAGTEHVGVINAGIGGNRVLLDGIGPNLLARFDRDVIARSGVTDVILLEGVNDLGTLTRDAPATPEEHARIVAEITGAYRQMAERAHAHGIRLIGGTITPFVGNDYYHPGPESEADRQAINAFIRTSGTFDAVIDFDAALRDPADPARMAAVHDSGDHLHPSPAGYAAMAAAVPLDLFADEAADAAPMLAITVDDLPAHGPLPPGETHLAVTQALIAAFRDAGATAPMGFVNAGKDEGDGEAVLRAWRQAGFPLGNHNWSHANVTAVNRQGFAAEVARNEPVLARLMAGEDWRWFRYPYLSEGDDAATVAAARDTLRSGNYRVAAVTMDFGDWAWNGAYARCVAKDDTAAIAALEDSYLQAARTGALNARAMAQGALGRDIPYVLLLHAGAFDARMMPRLLALYRELGFRFVPVELAQADPFYVAATDLSLPGPSPRLDRAAAAAGVPVPAGAAQPGENVCAG
ncbi:GDSL-type esterase/lipase family protein [Croceibacterium ferulae]|uniref:GDSL-type esterase/lipase family protein n=1 Tax=Croceibacterium ferulae TaxID=1854641 RepID=UPI001F4E1577|nr:GDSL-type esterase/lipase family protein [Croceibacterium ferulae]